MKKHNIFTAASLFLAILSAMVLPTHTIANTAEPKELRIMRVTPEGEDVPAGRQIVIEFNRPVVPLGRMDRNSDEIPVVITPKLNCAWRWLNTNSLACNLDEKNSLAAATKYQLTINPGIKAEDGATLVAPYQQTFITERADIKLAEQRAWEKPGGPVISLVTTQPVTKESLQQHLTFIVTTDDKKSYKVTVEKDKLPDDTDDDEEEGDEVTNEPDQPVVDQQPNIGQMWLIRPQRELPLASTVALHVSPGLVSTLGPEKSISDRDVLSFDTYPPFKFLGVSCRTNTGEEVLITVDNPQTELCSPLDTIALRFNTPVMRSQVYSQVAFTPKIPGGVDVWDLEGQDSQLQNPYAKENTFDVWLPMVKSAQGYQMTIKPIQQNALMRVWHWIVSLFSLQPLTALQDEFGRYLQTPVKLKFATDHRMPNFEMLYQNAVLEKATDSEVPLYVNNLDQFTFKYRSVTEAATSQDQSLTQHIPKAQDIQFALPLNIRKMLHGESGALYGSLTTEPNVPQKSDYARTLFAQVTPYQVEVKLGHFNSLVWVTDLATGHAVMGAKVTIYKDIMTQLSAPHDILATATTDAKGVAILPGTQALDPELTAMRQSNNAKPQLFVRIDKAQDMAILPLTDNFAINTWRVSDSSDYVYADSRKKYGHLIAWGTTAQGVYRVGDTVQYKFYVRNQDNKTLVPAPTTGYDLQVLDAMDKIVYEVKDIQLSEFGAYSGEFVISKQAPVGWYQFKLTANFPDKSAEKNATPEENIEITLYPLRVLISDFTPAAFKVTSDISGDLFKAGQTAEVTTTAKLHSGGAYTDAMVRVTASLDSKAFVSQNPSAKDFNFDSYRGDNNHGQQIFQKLASLNDKGELQTNFVLPKPQLSKTLAIYYAQLSVESAVQDDRGKYIAAHAGASYAGVDRLVGLKTIEWVYNAGKPAVVKYIVVDEKGNPVKDTPVHIEIERKVTSSARIKEAGNAYTTDYHIEWQPFNQCDGTPAESALTCEFTPNEAGDYRITALVKDTQGNEQSTQTMLWVVGKNYVLWDDKSDNYLTIIPEQKTYHVGDTARYLIKNPYPGAMALITIERYGVLDQFVQTFDSSSPMIEFPIKADYLPGFYLSVMVVSPRVDKPISFNHSVENQVDLGKPTYRMGYVTVPVKDAYKEIQVVAKTDQAVYRPRDHVTLQLHAQPKIPTDKPEPIEIAVAVLDEAVFDLLADGRDYFDPYKGFYDLQALDIQNYNLLTRLIGRQKFEKKGANPGGDGGVDLGVRDFFKFVSYWNPAIKTDANGNASVTFQAPDNLTGWRILAMAVTPGDRLGLGEADFKVNRPTEVRQVMPNQVTEGDHFNAGFSVMNRTDQTRTLVVNIQATGAIDTQKTPNQYQQTITLAPYKRTVIWMPVAVVKLAENTATQAGEIHFVARAGNSTDSDSMEYTLPVEKLRSLETVANYGTTTSDLVSESLLFPDNIYPDVGGLNVVVAPSVIANVEGAFKYLRDYPYDCWEQKLTKGVMAAHYQALKAYFPANFTWQNSQELPTETLNLAANYQAPNGGMTFYLPQDGYADPYLSAYTALAFNWLRHDGYSIPSQVENKLHDYLLNFLRRNVAPDYYSDGMTSTVRAVALAALADQGKITKDDLQRYLPYVSQMSLFGKTYFVQAAMQVKGAEEIALQVTKLILAHADQSGGKFIFSEKLDNGYQRILASPLRENCAILSTFTQLEKMTAGKSLVGDVPFKLASSITQTRKNRDHWENTQENMFCMNALVDYSRSYENVPPRMTVLASVDHQTFGETHFQQLTDAPVMFARSLQANDPGRKTTVDIKRQGQGRLYYATRLNFALKDTFAEPTNAGMEIHREYTVQRDGKWILLANPLQIKQGELVRVDIYLSLPAARNFVVVDDPVPGGLEPVNRDLATSSTVDANQAKFKAAEGSIWFRFNDWMDYGVSRWSFYHQELRNDSARFYADYLPAGNYHLSYSAQAIASGEFVVMPVKVEEMYNPDVFGKGVMQRLQVGEALL